MRCEYITLLLKQYQAKVRNSGPTLEHHWPSVLCCLYICLYLLFYLPSVSRRISPMNCTFADEDYCGYHDASEGPAKWVRSKSTRKDPSPGECLIYLTRYLTRTDPSPGECLIYLTRTDPSPGECLMFTSSYTSPGQTPHQVSVSCSPHHIPHQERPLTR